MNAFKAMLGKRVMKVETRELDELGDGESVNTIVRFTFDDGTELVVGTGCGDGPCYGTIGVCHSFTEAQKVSEYESESAKWVGKVTTISVKS